MDFLCPFCGNVIRGENLTPQQPVLCDRCNTYLIPPNPDQEQSPEAPRVEQPAQRAPAPPMQNSANIVPYVAPMGPQYPVVPVDVIRDDFQDRHDTLVEQRQTRREDRKANFVGITGLAINGTAVVLLLGAILFSSSIPGYLFFCAMICMLAGLIGTVCSVVGCALPGRDKHLAITGLCCGGLLLLMVPFAFSLATQLLRN